VNSSKERSAGRSAGRVRIIGGSLRSRLVQVPSRPGLRPTPDRVRETLFNWLGQELHGLNCLDLFAGSGALGFEAASRGAARVVMVDSDNLAVEFLRKNRTALGTDQVDVVQSGALQFLARAKERFELVFLDPPFRQNLLPEVLAALPERLSTGARVYVESAEALVPPGWNELKRGRAGQVSYQLLEPAPRDTQ
jgi:16S rRNA (guanine966-N2)-methyltransferase